MPTPPSSPRALDAEVHEQIFGGAAADGGRQSFQTLGLPSRLTRHMEERMSYHAPTKVQQLSIPPLLAKKCVCAPPPTPTSPAPTLGREHTATFPHRGVCELNGP